jgi:hypothetical protein
MAGIIESVKRAARRIFGGFKKMGKHDDEEEFIKEARETLAAANYPADLNRYFAVLRGRGFRMNVAGTYADNSERWDFNNGDQPPQIKVTIRFAHNDRSLAWTAVRRGSKDAEEIIKGRSLEQLEAQLNAWA